MRINLRCPFEQKDQARALGARWDPARKTWYIVDIEDLTPFMQWIRDDPAPSEPPPGSITLTEYLDQAYGRHKSLSAVAARAFGIPYPLENGWMQKHAGKTISAVAADALMKRKQASGGANPEKHPPATTGGEMKPACSCDVLPWDHCEHTNLPQ